MENAQTAGLPKQSQSTRKNIAKLKIYLSNGKVRHSTKKLDK